MKIIVKPMGVILLVVAVGGLTTLALRKPSTPSIAATIDSPSRARSTSGSESLPKTGAPEPIRGHAIFRDGVENSWQTAGWTWAKDVNFEEAKNVYAGSKAIRVRFNGYEGLKFHHAPLDTRTFDRVTFMIYGGAKGGQRLQVGGVCAEKSQGVSRQLPPLPAGKWASVTVRLADLKLEGKPDMTAFWIQGNSNTMQTDVYVDDVRLLVPGEPASPGTVLASNPI